MKTTFSNRKQFIIQAIKPHLGIIGIGLVFILFGSLFAYLGTKTEEGLGFIIFGTAFIVFSLAFMLYVLPSSFLYYYEQAEVKKYGSYTFATITNKRVEDLSYTSSMFSKGPKKTTKEFLFAIEFEFTYNSKIYKNECFFEHKSTFNAITKTTDLPIKFLKTNPKKVTIRRRKLSKQLGIPEKMCK